LTLAKGVGAKTTAVMVSEPWAAARTCHGSVAVPFDAYEQPAVVVASRSLAAVRDLARRLDIECATVHIKERTADGILHVARSRGCDLIVMASHRRCGLSRVILGGHASRVLELSPLPILICN
jgi:nucleotide-binding universal stress UspA family protein